MDTIVLQEFFMWCSVLNLGLTLLWGVMFMAAPGLAYRMQRSLFPLSRETFDTVFYGYLAVFKIMAVIFAYVPWLALVIMNSRG